MNDLVQFLSQVPLFASLTNSTLQKLATDPKIVEVPPKTILLREGDPGEHFYVVLEGHVEAVKRMDSEEEQFLSVRGPGEFVGEISLLHRGIARTASVVTREASKLLKLTRVDFDELLTHEPMMAYEMVRVLTLSLNSSNETHIRDLQEKNRELKEAFEALKAAQAQIIEKEKLERELQLASEIQMSILPQTFPQVEGFDFGAKLVPARTVAGDMYDFIPLSHNKVGIVVGDVTDKGVPAAIVMAQTHALLRSEAFRASTPREALKGVNQHLLEINSSGEDTKSGVEPAGLFKLVDGLLPLNNIRIRGLMTIGPFTDDETLIRQAFSLTRKKYEELASRYEELEIDTLSMGMSADYTAAIEEGSNMVRLGTVLFGTRRY